MKIKEIEEIGKLIRERRKSLGITQREVARYAGVGQRFMVELENGKESVRLGLAFRVMRALGLDLRVEARG